MTLARGLLVVVALCISVLVLVRDWRPALAMLLVSALATGGVVGLAARTSPGLPAGRVAALLLAIDLVTAISAVLILLITGLTYSHASNRGQLAEPGPAERRTAARVAPARWQRYLLPSLALLLLLAATALLPGLYPYPALEVDYAWTLLLLSGVFVLIAAGTVLRVGLGLVLLLFGLKLFYLAAAPRVGVVELALFELLTIMLALIVAYAGGLLHGRVKTLSLDALSRER